MLASEKIQYGFIFTIFAVVLVFTVIFRVGRVALEWILVKLYEFFIQHGMKN